MGGCPTKCTWARITMFTSKNVTFSFQIFGMKYDCDLHIMPLLKVPDSTEEPFSLYDPYQP